MSFVRGLSHAGIDCTSKECPCKYIGINLSIYTAAQYGDFATVQKRVLRDRSVINRTEDGYSMLHLAAQVYD